MVGESRPLDLYQSGGAGAQPSLVQSLWHCPGVLGPSGAWHPHAHLRTSGDRDDADGSISDLDDGRKPDLDGAAHRRGDGAGSGLQQRGALDRSGFQSCQGAAGCGCSWGCDLAGAAGLATSSVLGLTGLMRFYGKRH